MVAGKVGRAIVDTAKLGVTASDAGTNWTYGKIAGDADHENAPFAVSVAIFAFGGAGLAMIITTTELTAKVGEYVVGTKRNPT